jgi:hypothetical protein
MSTDPLNDLLRTLSAPARTDELVGEAEAVARMRSVVASVDVKEPPTMHASPSRRNRIATLVAAGVIGFGGVAAAGPGNFLPSADDPFVTDVPEDKPTETTEPAATTSTAAATSTTTTTQPATAQTVTTEALIVVPLVDDPTTEFDETLCAEGNHGKTVSSVAHATESGPGKGEIVSTAAHSSCGKDATDDGEDVAADVEADDAGEDADQGGKPDHAGKPEDTGRPDDAGSRSNRDGNKHDD